MIRVLGVDRRTGQPINGIEHLKQSIEDILTTRKGSRRERPEYGSNLPLLVDKPLTLGLKSIIQGEAARAIDRWEPRLELHQVNLVSILEGSASFVIRGDYLGDAVLLEIRA